MTIHQRYIDHIQQAFKDPSELDLFLEFCQRPLKKSIKVNKHRINVQEFIDITSKRWWHLTNPWFIQGEDDIFYIDRDNLEMALWRTFLHQSWYFYMQEISASMPAKFLDLKENDIVLDISSAPWGKSVQIWDQLLCLNPEKPWFVVSNDVSSSRLIALAHNLNRMWIYNSWITKFNWFSFGKNIPEFFNHVLVDAPCSWEWTWFKSDFAMKFWKQEEINKIAWTQFQLIVSAIKATKPGWSIIFSTCTMNPTENELNVKRILEFFWWSVKLAHIDIIWKSNWLEKFWDVELLSSQDAATISRFWPHIQKTWWFFISKFIKTDTINKNDSPQSKLFPRNPFKLEMWKSIQTKVNEYFSRFFWFEINLDKYMFVATKEQIYITSDKFNDIKDKLQFEKIWTPIFKINKDWTFRPTHHLGIIFGSLSKFNYVEFDETMSQEYANWKDLDPNKALVYKKQWEFPYVIIKWQWKWIWIWKILDWMIKNKYIK